VADIPQTLAAALQDRYVLERELGRGGMATVYLAEDLKHHRQVALKVLSPELAGVLGPERFLREIEIAAGLHHPHILPLYDSGEAAGMLFYVMPYVEGRSLRDRLARERQLPIEDALRIAREVADALSYAHSHGVVHRDIKPENILLEAEHAVVADFGIARAVSAAGGHALTVTGITLGTPAYMSPEQAAGSQELDGRSDLYSLACVLYEMLAGQPPFTGPTAGSVVHQHMTADPPPITQLRPAVSAELAGTLARALAKTPADRFNPVAQFADALTPRWSPATGVAPATRLPPAPGRRITPWRLAAMASVAAAVLGAGYWLLAHGRTDRQAAGAGAPRVVVLPFTNLGAAADQYFADGVTEEITSRTGQVPGLEVIARSSAAGYKGTNPNVSRIGKELGVQYVLEGSVRWQRSSTGAGQVRVTPQLIRVADGTQVWTERYDAVLADIFQVQSDIAEKIAGALGLALHRPDSAGAAPTGSLEAYDYYLQGNEYANRGVAPEDLKAAVQMYQRALQRDSSFALAYAHLAYAHTEMYWFRHDPTPERLAQAGAALDRAVGLLPGNPEVELAQGYYAYWGHRDYDAALTHFRNALRARPSDAEANFGIAAVERRQGKFQQALAGFQRALELDPRSSERARAVAETCQLLGRFPEAERYFDRAIALAPDQASAYDQKARLYEVWRGGTGEARKTLEEGVKQGARGEPDILQFDLVNVDRLEGKYQGALTRLRGISSEMMEIQLTALPTAQYFADVHALLGHREIARAYEDTAVAVLRAQRVKRADDAALVSALGIAYAGLGRKEEAIREGQRAVEMLPLSKDAWAGGYRLRELARIYTMVGDQDAAIGRLEDLLSVPSDFSTTLLRLDPACAPLRGNPRFQRLVNGS
jgi:eukaryotic-like serine/threonine-protein kinase